VKTTITAKMTSSFLADMDALVDQSIDSMSPKQLKEFQKKRKKITADCRSRAASSSSPLESEEQEKRVLQA
jgi:hypothetical protein